MKQSKTDLVQRYREALKRCLDAFSRLDEKDWDKKASEHWTAKEHLAHLVSNTEDELLVITRQAIAGQPAKVSGFEKQDDAILIDLLAEWAPDEATRNRILVDNPATVYGFGKSS